MAEKIGFTEKRIKELEPTPGKQVEYFDTTDRLFGIRVSPGGTKTFFVKKRVHGVLIRVCLGVWPDVSLLKAREDFHDAFDLLRKGINPNLDKKRRTAENTDKRGILSAVFESYLDDPSRETPLKDLTRQGYRYSFNLLSAWHGKRVEDITKDMVKARFEEITENSGPYAANRTISLLKYAMAHSMETLKRPAVNPAEGIKWRKEHARREAMPPETVPAFIAALDNIKGDSGRDLYTLLLFTGLRKSEAMKLQWSNVDLDKGSLHITDTKNGSELNIPLSGFVVALLKARKERIKTLLWIFPSNSRTGHITNTSQFDEQITAQGIKVYPHYLRKTFTTAAAMQCKGDIVDILTGHIPQGVTGKHYTAPSVEQLREPLERITATIVRMAETGKV